MSNDKSTNPFSLGTGLEEKTPTDENPFVLGSGTEDEKPEKEHITKKESFARGGTQAFTLGAGDEMSGGVDVALDKVNALLNKLGLAAPSPSQVSQQLKDQGFTGDIGPTTVGEIYRSGRDEERLRNDEAFKQNPGSFLAGSVAGGAASIPLMPSGVLAPLKVAKDASLLTKVGVGAANAVPLAAIASANTSNAELTDPTLQSVGQFAGDTVKGTAIGAGIGGAVPVAGAYVSDVANELNIPENLSKAKSTIGGLVPEKVKQAWTAARERGLDLSNKDNHKNQMAQLHQEADTQARLEVPDIETVSPNTSAQAMQDKTSQLENVVNSNQTAKKQIAQSTDENLKNIEQQRMVIKGNLTKEEEALAKHLKDTRLNTEQELDQITEQAKTASAMQEQLQKTQNQQEGLLIRKRLADTSHKLQATVGKAKNAIKKKYDLLDDVIGNEGIPVNHRETISNFELAMEDAGVPVEVRNRFMKKLMPLMGLEDFQSHLKVKQILGEARNHMDIGMKKAAGQAYRQANETVHQSLMNAGKNELADTLAQTNREYGALLSIEDQFVGNTRPDFLTGQSYVDPMTSKTIDAFKERTINQAEGIVPEFSDKLTMITPEAPAMLQEIDQVAQAQLANKAFKPQVTPVPEMLASNPDAVRRQQILNDFKFNRFQDSTTRAADKNIAGINKQLSTLDDDAKLLQQSNQVAQNNADRAIQAANKDLQTLGVFESTRKELTSILPKLGQKSADGNAVKRLNDMMDRIRRESGDEVAKQVETRLTNLATDMGLTQFNKNWKYVNPAYVANQVGKFFPKTPEQIQGLASKLAQDQSPVAQTYARQLQDSLTKSDSARTAIMFQLMQQSAFRQYLNNEDSGSAK